jgi:hypothetical protein
MTKFSILLLWVCFGVRNACASPWPVEASIAYVEQLELACARIQPEKKVALQSKMKLLFSEGPDVVSKARATKEFEQMKKWAQDEIVRLSEQDFIDQCDSFLANSDLALHQKYPTNPEPVPGK